ncbi:hypothetical protein V5O48_014677 [Marasmius crinis-equi]|uniref:Uncharacterized protein n=1 Tax=Marasmius crinis-equi TaxID=585013 RepID=A0ABR3EWN9_9AGAR
MNLEDPRRFCTAVVFDVLQTSKRVVDWHAFEAESEAKGLEGQGGGNIVIEATKIEIDTDDDTVTGFTGLGRNTETASFPVPSVPRTPTRMRARRSFELTVPAPSTSCPLSPFTPRTSRRFDSEDGEIPPMPSTPVKGDMAIASRRKAREEGRE